MSDETSLDVAGVGKLAKAIPAKAWTQLVDTACTTFREAMAPLTATTSGLGRLITAKFDRLVEAEKVLAAETMATAQRKVATSKRGTTQQPNANIVVAALDNSACQTDPILRELWANLLAQELVTGSVHPEFPHILARLSAAEAQLLAHIAERENSKNEELKRIVTKFSASFFGVSLSVIGSEGISFAHEHLHQLNLITDSDRVWRLTLTGRAFIAAVTEP